MAVVGITCGYRPADGYYFLREGYWESVVRAGGIPVLLPPIESVEIAAHFLEICDGFIFSGGDDIDPAFWGGEPETGLGEVDPRRDIFEIQLARMVVGSNVPSLFICRGIQVLNVALGGDLIQNLRSNQAHRQKAPRNHPFHEIVVEKGSLIYDILEKDVLRVNSFHHQAIRRLAEGLSIAARAHDGVIEAVEYPGKKCIIGVQWHPEAIDDIFSSRLFKFLVDSSSLGRLER